LTVSPGRNSGIFSFFLASTALIISAISFLPYSL
jgi:hypothetical protein